MNITFQLKKDYKNLQEVLEQLVLHSLVDLVTLHWKMSKSGAKREIEAGAVQVNHEKITDITWYVQEYDLIRLGKTRPVRLKLVKPKNE